MSEQPRHRPDPCPEPEPGNETPEQHAARLEDLYDITAADAVMRRPGKLIPLEEVLAEFAGQLSVARYAVFVPKRVRKEIRKLDPVTRTAILGILSNLAVEPRPGGACALKGFCDYLRLRIGDYRVVYTVDDEAREVIVAVAGHRREVYRRLG